MIRTRKEMNAYIQQDMHMNGIKLGGAKSWLKYMSIQDFGLLLICVIMNITIIKSKIYGIAFGSIGIMSFINS